MPYQIAEVQQHTFLTPDYKPEPPIAVDVSYSDYLLDSQVVYREGPGQFKVVQYDNEGTVIGTAMIDVPEGKRALIGYTGLLNFTDLPQNKEEKP
jgi:hypothetical protein